MKKFIVHIIIWWQYRYDQPGGNCGEIKGVVEEIDKDKNENKQKERNVQEEGEDKKGDNGKD